MLDHQYYLFGPKSLRNYVLAAHAREIGDKGQIKDPIFDEARTESERLCKKLIFLIDQLRRYWSINEMMHAEEPIASI